MSPFTHLAEGRTHLDSFVTTSKAKRCLHEVHFPYLVDGLKIIHKTVKMADAELIVITNFNERIL